MNELSVNSYFDVNDVCMRQISFIHIGGHTCGQNVTRSSISVYTFTSNV